MGRYSSAIHVLLLCSLVPMGHVVSREIETSRSEVTGEGEESTLHGETLAEALRVVCSHTKDAFFEDAAPLHADRELRERYSDFVQEADAMAKAGEQGFFLPKPITSMSLSTQSSLLAIVVIDTEL